MSKYSRDLTILLNMRKYCRYITQNLSKIENGFEEFKSNPLYRDSISMEIQQIGELTKDLSEGFIKETKSKIPWPQIKGMRNRFAHGYGKMDFEKIYNTAITDIPALHKFLDEQIEKLQKEYLEENNE